MNERFKNWEYPLFDEDGYAYKRVDGEQVYGKGYGWKCDYIEGLKLGKNTDVGCFSYLMAKEGIIIGDDVQIGGGVMIYSVDTIDNISGNVVLKRNCKIGANTVILPCCVIGKNSIIGAGSVVPSYYKIPKNEVWVGVPVKFKRLVK